jgi:hypothetical protein
VPVPDALRALSLDPAFWAEYFFHAEPAGEPDPAELRATFPISHGYGLVLDLDRVYGTYALGLRTPTSIEPIPMGWDDQSHWHPHCLHWSELDLVGRVVALDDPSLPHPGLPVVLLCRFAPITAADDPDAVRALLQAALRSLRPPPPDLEQEPLFPYAPRVLTERQIGEYARLPEPGDLRTLRISGSERFPYEGLAELVRLAQSRLARLTAEPWCTERVRALAGGLAGAGDAPGVGALLAELEAAGCDHPTVLDALTDPVTPTEAAWVVETLAGRVPVPLGGRTD